MRADTYSAHAHTNISISSNWALGQTHPLHMRTQTLQLIIVGHQNGGLFSAHMHADVTIASSRGLKRTHILHTHTHTDTRTHNNVEVVLRRAPREDALSARLYINRGCALMHQTWGSQGFIRARVTCSQYDLFPIWVVPNMSCSQYELFPLWVVPNMACSQYDLFPINMICSQYDLFLI